MVHSFTWSPPPPNPIPVTLILYSPPTPTAPSLNPADGGSFVQQHPGNNIKGLLGVNAECLKNKTKLKNKEVPEGLGDLHSSREKSYHAQEGTEREQERKKERLSFLAVSSCLSDINHHLLSEKRCGLGRPWFNDNNKQMTT